MDANADMYRKAVAMMRETIAAAPAPKYMQIAIQHLREKDNVSADMRDFLEHTKDLPSGAVVVIADGEFSLLTDSDGNLLSFR